jgi:hypothetical protein
MSKVRERAANARYIARHPVKMVRYSATNTRWHNWRNGAAIERGRAPRLDGAVAAVTSRAPVVRDRVNPATGRKRRDDAMMHRSRNEGLARSKALNTRITAAESALERQRQEPARARRYAQERGPAVPRQAAWESGPDAYRHRAARTRRTR